MTEEIDYFKQGRKACRTYYTGQATSNLTKHVKAEDAMKLYWPPIEEYLSQISSPLPKPRQKWIAGFKKEQVIIKAEMQIKCLHCGQATCLKEKLNDDSLT